MQYAIVRGNGFLEVRTLGNAELGGLANMVDELLSHPHWEPGGKLLVDHSELNAGPITVDEVRVLADKVTQVRERFGHARCAHLVARSLEFGLVRMWEAYVEGRWDTVTMCFRSRVDAISWLEGR